MLCIDAALFQVIIFYRVVQKLKCELGKGVKK